MKSKSIRPMAPRVDIHEYKETKEPKDLGLQKFPRVTASRPKVATQFYFGDPCAPPTPPHTFDLLLSIELRVDGECRFLLSVSSLVGFAKHAMSFLAMPGLSTAVSTIRSLLHIREITVFTAIRTCSSLSSRRDSVHCPFHPASIVHCGNSVPQHSSSFF
jgi:hypothetical protein